MSSNLDVGPFGGGNTAVFQDVQANSIAGQTVTATITVVDFNTTVISKPFVTLSSNQFTFDKGKYRIDFIDAQNGSANGQGHVFAVNTGGTSLGGFDYHHMTPTTGEGPEIQKSFYIDITTANEIVEIFIEGSGSRPAKSGGYNEYYQQIYITKVG